MNSVIFEQMATNSVEMGPCETFSFSIYHSRYKCLKFKRPERNIQFISKMSHKINITLPTGIAFEVTLDEEEYGKFVRDDDYRNDFVSQLSAQVLQSTPVEVGQQAEMRSSGSGTYDDGLLHSQYDREFGIQKRAWSVEDEETLIRLVSERPPLFDYKLPMRQRTKMIVKNLWREIIEEMNVDLDEEAISKKWKNLRDSYMRARSIINRKSASGASAENRLKSEKIKKNHRHYELLTFLDSSLATRWTTSNLEDSQSASREPGTPPRSPLLSETPSTSRGSQGERSSARRKQGELSLQDEASSSRGKQAQLSSADEAFLEAIKELRPIDKREATPIEQFCSRLADGLSKLPRSVSNKLQVEFLTKLVEQEDIYLP